MPLIPLYDITAHPLLSDKYTGLKTDDQREAHHLLAEMLLNLHAPAYTGDKADELVYAVVLQVNFQLQQTIEPHVVRSISNNHPGNTTLFRDRYVSPAAWAIRQRVTGARTVGFTPPGIGV